MEADASNIIQQERTRYVEVEETVEVPVFMTQEEIVHVPKVIPFAVIAFPGVPHPAEQPPLAGSDQTTCDQGKITSSKASAEPASEMLNELHEGQTSVSPQVAPKVLSAEADSLREEEIQDVTQGSYIPQQTLPSVEQLSPTTATAAEQAIQAFPSQAEVPVEKKAYALEVCKSQKFVDVPHVEPSHKRVDVPQVEMVDCTVPLVVPVVVQKHVHVPMVTNISKSVDVPMVEFVGDPCLCETEGFHVDQEMFEKIKNRRYNVDQETFDRIMRGESVSPEEILSDPRTHPWSA